MTFWLSLIATGLLASLAGALWRVWRGPRAADRMMGAQLVGTAGVAVLMLLAPAEGWATLDVALLLALLAALAAIGFAKATSPDGAGDPEEDGAGDPEEQQAAAADTTDGRADG
ncbi:MAG: monovalent cation/H+ antiporter complex subunit F [Rhodovibrio sp.]|nr:monovalent cation/H+ antiporter complex subunit F [Rhodovibrio sp.]